MATFTKCRNCGFFSLLQYDILSHFNLNFVFPFFVLLYTDCGWAGWMAGWLVGAAFISLHIQIKHTQKTPQKRDDDFCQHFFVCSFSTSFEPLSIISHC